MDAALIDHGSGVGGSFSEIPLVGGISRGPTSLSSSPASSSPPRDQRAAARSTPSGGGNGNAGLATTGLTGSHPPVRPPATAAPISSSTEDVSKVGLAIMACNISLIVPVVVNFKDLTISWDATWKDLYAVLMMASFASTVTGLFTAWTAVSWIRRLSHNCARFGLVDAAALFIVFLACKLGRFGCAAGVASAALVVLVLAFVWAWSERRSAPPGGAEAEAVVAVAQQGAQLPHDAP